MPERPSKSQPCPSKPPRRAEDHSSANCGTSPPGPGVSARGTRKCAVPSADTCASPGVAPDSRPARTANGQHNAANNPAAANTRRQLSLVSMSHLLVALASNASAHEGRLSAPASHRQSPSWEALEVSAHIDCVSGKTRAAVSRAEANAAECSISRRCLKAGRHHTHSHWPLLASLSEPANALATFGAAAATRHRQYSPTRARAPTSIPAKVPWL